METLGTSLSMTRWADAASRPAFANSLMVQFVDFAGIVARLSFHVMAGAVPPPTASPLSTAENRWMAGLRQP